MLRDVFYYGSKPNVHPREKFAKSLEDARRQATTEHFWIINEYCDYRGFDWDFDFEFLPDEDVWAENHNNVWPSQHQKDSGTWLCPKKSSDVIIYRNDVDVVKRKNIINHNWKLLEKIDVDKFDFSWHPDPTDPPFIYAWGCKFFPVEFYICLEYHVPGATEYKYMDTIVELLPNYDYIKEIQEIDKTKFDLSWRPDPMDPPYVYVWGNKYIPAELKSTLEYHVPGATEKKYMPEVLQVLPESDRWEIPNNLDVSNFDFSWRPDPREPEYIWQFGTQWQKTGGPRYIVPNAIEIKYVDTQITFHLPNKESFNICKDIDESSFDFSWHPDSSEPPYIYVWGNKHVSGEIESTIEYRCQNANTKKFVDNDVNLKPKKENFIIHRPINENKFDFSWIPDPTSPPYIYVWGNKHVASELEPTVEYHVSGATQYKHMGVVDLVPDIEKWKIFDDIDKTKFDLTWCPDPREPAYIYTWGNKYVPAEIQPTLEYHTPSATERKYMGNVDVLPQLNRWVENEKIDKTKFDLSWRPDPREPAYIYTWGNKYVPAEIQPTLEYHVPGATERKYMGDVEVLPKLSNWKEHQKIDKTKFDLSWRPDPREPAYIYTWGNKWIPAEVKPTLEYHVSGATERKYMGNVDVLPDMNLYKISCDITNFDFTWRPDPREPAYIYTWGNKYVPAEIQPTLEYNTPGATQRKYMGNVEVLPEMHLYKINCEVTNFDFTWRPDPREPAYIYTWGNKYVPAEIQPTLEYNTPGATERKYMGNVDVLPETDKWNIYVPVDLEKFDLSWRPDPREPAYIYTWGNKYVPAEIQPTLEYNTPGATERKYMGNVDVLPQWDKYKIHTPVKNFDFTWSPDPREPAYIYVWGNRHIRPEIQPTLEYKVPGAIEYKYMQEPIEVLPQTDRWNVVQNVINFDFTWRPDPREPAYIYTWGNKWIPAEVKPTLEYHTPGATDRKYMGDVDVEPEYDRYKILLPIDKSSFDFTWRPDPNEPPYIYVWGNQSNKAEVEPTIEYYCDGATDRKYINDIFAKTLPDIENWKILIPVDDFDFTWRPDPGSPPYIYVFGNQWHDATTEPTVEYHITGAKDKKYIKEIVGKVSKTQENWKTLIPVDEFDYSWRPNPHSQPYIYVFGNQWHDGTIEPTIEYHQPGAVDKKYVNDIKAIVKSTATDTKWKRLLDVEFFDYSWRPDPGSPPYIYVFGNKWNDAATEPTIEYHCEGATDKKYINHPVAITKSELRFWSVSNNEDLETFDFSWRPNPYSPPQIYQWENNGPTYTVPGAKEVVYMRRDSEINVNKINRYYIKTTLEDLINEHINEVFWALNPDLNYDNFDFSWTPNEQNFRHINVFGNEYSIDTQTYYVNGPMYALGYKNFNYIETHKVESVETNLDMFFIDRGNKNSLERFNNLKTLYPKLQKTRYLNSWVDTISRCVKKSTTKLFWILSSEIDYSDFKFDFYPSKWQMNMIHVFGTQWSHWGNTYLINGDTFLNDTKYVKIIEHLSNLNFVKSKKAKASDCLYDVYFIDHENVESENIKNNIAKLTEGVNLYTIPFSENYSKTFRNLISKVENKNFIWVVNSICDYSNFDFSYICDPYTREQLHVFPSNKQMFGDTFLVNTQKLKDFLFNIKNLKDYEGINFNQHQKVSRLPAPTIVSQFDTHVTSSTVEFNFPYANFVVADNQNLVVEDLEPMSLWSNESKTVKVLSTGATYITTPKEIKNYVKTQLYDYPYIVEGGDLIESNPLDIVFLSNGEKNSDENYEHLLKITKNYNNRVVRVDGVKGRANAYRAAAKISNTPWMFTVFAKLKVNLNFDWTWQPDRLQIPKHYIFNAKNPVNNLIYGHQAIIAYNKNLVLNNEGYGLDFTLDDPHESVDIYSGMAYFNTDPFSTWRTAFREAIKLMYDNTEISNQRLEVWLTKAEGEYSDYCIKGANDGVKYYEEVNGDFDKLKLSYEWEWLVERYKHDNP